jgi:membrane-associated phospholipid phosphatase
MENLDTVKIEEVRVADRLARILSYIFDGTFISIPIFIIICLLTIQNTIQAMGWAFLCILFGVIIPYIYVLILFRRKRIFDMHIPNKKNRMKPLIISFLSYSAGLVVMYILKAPLILKSIFTISVISSVIFMLVTNFWKISLHTSWITFVVITFYILFGIWMLLLTPLVPIVGWARVKIRRHTITQVVLGAGVSCVTAFLIYNYYGFIDLFFW